MIFCLAVALLQFGAAVQFGAKGMPLKATLMVLYGMAAIVLAFMKEG